jgi:hypothetical protein
VLLINKLTKPGDIKRVEIRPDRVHIVLRDGPEKTYFAVVGIDGAGEAVEDKVIADNVKDYWRHQRSGAER